MLMNRKVESSVRRMKIKEYLEKDNRNVTVTLLISFVIVFSIIIISSHFSSFFTQFRLSGFERGVVAPRDLIADQKYSFIDKNASELKIENELAMIFPIFEMDNDKINNILNRFSTFSQMYLDFSESPSLNLKLEIQTMLSDVLSIDEIDFLLNNVDPASAIPLSSEILEKILGEGVFEQTNKLNYNDFQKIQLWKWVKGQRIFNILDSENIITLDDVDKLIDSELSLKTITDPEKSAVKLITSAFIQENVFFNEIQTQLRYDEIRKKIEPVVEEIIPGDYIIRRGYVVSAMDLEKAMVLNEKNKKIGIFQTISSFFFLLLLYIFAFLIFKPLFTGKKRKYQYIYLLNSFFIVFILYSAIILQFNFTVGYNLSLFLPTALFGMMIAILIGFQESILSVMILSISLFLFQGTTVYVFIFSLITGISSSFLMKGVLKRIDLLKPAVFLAGINLIVLLIGYPKYIDVNRLVIVIMYAILNAFVSSILNLTLIPVFEHLLNIPTVFKLMELSDMNTPIFRKMVTMAPGTYAHSMAVANLADAACRDIGANPILARVGAYYHDLGKLDQSEYFIENQTEANKHDMLNPSLSVAVIKSHVKVGIEKAKEMGLPFEVIDIIAQHHGSGLIGYFYIEAINKKGNKKSVQPEDYSYTGIPPESKEAAVVMLADTVEAATRVLKNPTILKLEKFIWKLIMDKIESGQMSNTSLTMNDMLIIKKSFVNILSGYFHTRIEYPKLKQKKL